MKLYCHLRLPSVSTLILVFPSDYFVNYIWVQLVAVVSKYGGAPGEPPVPFSWSQILGYDLGEKGRKKKIEN